MRFLFLLSPIVWNMCENLRYESVYFKELHNEQGLVHTYPDKFESTSFSLRIQKFARPQVVYSNRISPSTRIRIHS